MAHSSHFWHSTLKEASSNRICSSASPSSPSRRRWSRSWPASPTWPPCPPRSACASPDMCWNSRETSTGCRNGCHAFGLQSYQPTRHPRLHPRWKTAPTDRRLWRWSRRGPCLGRSLHRGHRECTCRTAYTLDRGTSRLSALVLVRQRSPSKGLGLPFQVSSPVHASPSPLGQSFPQPPTLGEPWLCRQNCHRHTSSSSHPGTVCSARLLWRHILNRWQC